MHQTASVDGLVGTPGAGRHFGTARWQVRGQRLRRVVVWAASLLLLCGLLSSAAQGARNVRRSPGFSLGSANQPGTLAAPVGAPTAAQPNASDLETIPFFSSSFSYNGTTYPYQNVGSNPAHRHITFVRAVGVEVRIDPNRVFEGEVDRHNSAGAPNRPSCRRSRRTARERHPAWLPEPCLA